MGGSPSQMLETDTPQASPSCSAAKPPRRSPQAACMCSRPSPAVRTPAAVHRGPQIEAARVGGGEDDRDPEADLPDVPHPRSPQIYEDQGG